jgi:acetate kinase
MPEVAQQLAVPDPWQRAGVRRYGFHGLSYEHVVHSLGLRDAPGRVVVAHLGSGASLAALRDGRSVDTTMGLTPAGGLVMSGRSGDLDPGVLTWALRTGIASDADDLDARLDRDAGLRGLSGATGDMRELLAARARGDARAALAIAVFVRSVRKHVGALTAALGGLDRLVFTGGIGEHSAPIRTEVVDGLGHLGPPPVDVVPTDEESVIARHAAAVVLGDAG